MSADDHTSDRTVSGDIGKLNAQARKAEHIVESLEAQLAYFTALKAEYLEYAAGLDRMGHTGSEARWALAAADATTEAIEAVSTALAVARQVQAAAARPQ